MEFNQLLAELDKLNLPEDQYAIASSGPMAVRGIRPANDLDILVTSNLFKELAKKYPVKHLELGDIIEISEFVQGLGDFKPELNLDVRSNEKQIKDAEVIDGHRFTRLEDVICFKKVLGREKDLKDIELINQFLSKNS